MATTVIRGIEGLRQHVGSSLGASRYVTVTQDMIDRFADLTGDHQWIHVDPAAAATGPFGSTVVHGYLTLSLGPLLAPDVFEVTDVVFGVNYGANRLRFPAPLPVDARVRLEIELLEVAEVAGGHRVRMEYVFVAEGADKPCCVAEVLVQYFDEVPGGSGNAA